MLLNYLPSVNRPAIVGPIGLPELFIVLATVLIAVWLAKWAFKKTE